IAKRSNNQLYNYLWKLMANSVYGQMAQGIGKNKRFDTKDCTVKILNASKLTNPLIATYVTGFVRALMSEQLHKIHQIKGKVVSITTDGYITDIKDLEDKFKLNYLDLSYKTREMGYILRGDKKILELKTTVNDLISWSTRGQHGINTINKNQP